MSDNQRNSNLDSSEDSEIYITPAKIIKMDFSGSNTSSLQKSNATKTTPASLPTASQPVIITKMLRKSNKDELFASSIVPDLRMLSEQRFLYMKMLITKIIYEASLNDHQLNFTKRKLIAVSTVLPLVTLSTDRVTLFTNSIVPDLQVLSDESFASVKQLITRSFYDTFVKDHQENGSNEKSATEPHIPKVVGKKRVELFTNSIVPDLECLSYEHFAFVKMAITETLNDTFQKHQKKNATVIGGD